ncbi:MAG: GSCFA domain-containing protein [Candidatus Nanopelagicales bacterium]|nr:GSCFA domain-containing protein [Candidatus Nanopelagicales bacterium]
MSTPYSDLPDRSFWRAGLAQGLVPRDVPNPPEIRISSTDLIGTAGSCFAQHIGRALRRSGFRLADVEPAPPMLAHELHSDFGYGIYSARYGNIYTTRQLRQLIARAFGKFRPIEDAWETDGRWFDPFRPSIEPGGFASRAELEASRESHLRSVRRLFRRIDVLVFTLGLTESWRSRADGAAFPVCPGTVAGEFDEDRHVLVNMTYPEVYSDMEWVISTLRRRRPNLRFVLTVSPVPLTATASGNHVLAATTYSKSVLRAVAGDLAASFPGVDYFPSYELITTPSARSENFENNLRTVRSAAVDTVMDAFLESFCLDDPSLGSRSAIPPVQKRAVDSFDEDVLCDEAALDAFK